MSSDPFPATRSTLRKRTSRLPLCIVGTLFWGTGYSQPIYTSDTTPTSALALAEDIAITHAATLNSAADGSFSLGANEVARA